MPCGRNSPRSFIGAACCGPALMMAKKGCKESESHKSVSAPKGTSLLDETHTDKTLESHKMTQNVSREALRDGKEMAGQRVEREVFSYIWPLCVASPCGLGFFMAQRLGSQERNLERSDRSFISCHDLVSEVTWCHFLNITGPPSPARRKKLRPSTLSGQSVNIPLQQAPIGGRSHCSHRGECDLPIAKSFLDKDVKLKDKSDSRAQGGRESEE